MGCLSDVMSVVIEFKHLKISNRLKRVWSYKIVTFKHLIQFKPSLTQLLALPRSILTCFNSISSHFSFTHLPQNLPQFISLLPSVLFFVCFHFFNLLFRQSVINRFESIFWEVWRVAYLFNSPRMWQLIAIWRGEVEFYCPQSDHIFFPHLIVGARI